MTALFEDLLEMPLRHGQPHHVDLRVSRDFFDGTDELPAVRAEFEAERDRLAAQVTARYGEPVRRSLEAYFADDLPDEPGRELFEHLTTWFFEVDLWVIGDRGLVLEVGHADRELPLQLMVVVGDLSRP
ncbi:hypothetical protein [Catenuloplanes atrovinosus]|uniref:Uncharacterized protein n=1 Tax=Catenuloplanes atrovinosus TaxID=137266 RepID=A0AAE3YJU8_9ACTN|nr:hypothetical protein [Catenuloplanes atrovinosus]MDR7274237.1 hypothetical protein [Catenuloplanes atrovinosus]